jgi:hypothetical protein
MEYQILVCIHDHPEQLLEKSGAGQVMHLWLRSLKPISHIGDEPAK